MSYLDRKYIDMVSPRLSRFGWKKAGLAACRCPICGDSKKSKTKTRFFFYEKKGGYFVKCHNCDYGTTLGKFLENYDTNLYKQYTMEKYAEGMTSRNESRTPEMLVPKTRVPVAKKRLVDLPTISSLAAEDETHPAVEFVRSRLIPFGKWDRLYYAEDFAEFAETIDPTASVVSEPRLVIPMIRDGVLEGATGRLLDGDGIRYIMVKRDQGTNRLWFGLDEVDTDETVYITEGSLDSLFVENAVAMNGLGAVDLPASIKDPVFVLDNEPRNRELVKTMDRLIQDGRHVVIYPPTVMQKDINEIVLSGITSTYLMKMIKTNTTSGMEAKLRLSTWRKC